MYILGRRQRIEAMRFFNQYRQGNDTAVGALPVLDSSNVYTPHLRNTRSIRTIPS